MNEKHFERTFWGMALVGLGLFVVALVTLFIHAPIVGAVLTFGPFVIAGLFYGLGWLLEKFGWTD